MAFSIRQIISNIPYFKKSDDEDALNDNLDNKNDNNLQSGEQVMKSNNYQNYKEYVPKTPTINLSSIQETKKISLSDTDLVKKTRKGRKKCRNLKLDIEKANKSANEMLNLKEKYNNRAVENTPQQITLYPRSSEVFSERLKGFDLNKSFDVYELMNDDKNAGQNIDVESLSEQSDSDMSIISETTEVKMCRKVQDLNESFILEEKEQITHSSSTESFADVEIDKNEEDRLQILQNYQNKFDKLEHLLQKLLTEFQFHIEVSQVFQTRSIVTLPEANIQNFPKKIMGDLSAIDNISRSESPAGGWNIIIENEDKLTKFKLRKQLLSMKHFIDTFINVYLQDDRELIRKPNIQSIEKTFVTPIQTLSQIKKLTEKRFKINKRKTERRINDFPDYREALENLFKINNLKSSSPNDLLTEYNDFENEKCTCTCKFHVNRESSPSVTDSGLITKEDKSNHSITSSIGNFSLDSLSLSAYSDTLDNIISYNSFNDSTLYSSILQKAAIERITFYVQVHSIQLKGESTDFVNYESKSLVIFNCHSCTINEDNERDLLKHIFSQKHCEKIHFLYKTSYIKQCLANKKEILPSTVLNPMTMYRDDNKIVCFGDGVYACSLCFENNIVGESVLMAHCNDSEHIDRRGQLVEFME